MLSQELLYDRPRNLSIYTCDNKVLVKRTYNEKCWGAAYVREPVIFCNDFSTFNDYSGENVELVRYIEGILNSKLFRDYSFYMTKVKAAKKPEVVKEDILHFPMPIYEKERDDIQKFVNLVIRMENLVSAQYKNVCWEGNSKEELQNQLDDMVYKLYGLDEYYISVIEEGISRFNKEKNIVAEDRDYQVYSHYLCNYFNYYMKDKIESTWRSQLQVGDFYATMSFFFKEETELVKKKVDLLGLMGVEKINSRLLYQNKILLFEESGFQIIQTKEKFNWSLGKAKKMAAKITREIMQTGGNYNEK